ncbi:hypothetical protein [Reinekea marinisedimentorum]|uniref:Polysaccharide lyase-like protein n=1 Tax=Reinekea marinisedimentorum TaxID=230495 RepID=A0A4R3I297_9GAMM|nr:hypothetical protein [Reinekea marinisedimentorum]TCS38765.1 hypothetical protein BCF53_11539 [Reinekea marinisedimentorum]
MKTFPLLARRSLIFACSLTLVSAAFAGSFSDVTWTQDYSNSPTQDTSGSGTTPSTSGATNSMDTYTFIISTSDSSTTQRQEWKYERRSGLMAMTVYFKINSDYSDDFDKIGIAQNHDDQTGSEGVFAIYQVRKNGSNWEFGVQGDTTDASNSYSTFDTVEIELDTWYKLRVRSYVGGVDDSYENGRLIDSSTGEILWEENIEGGGDDEGYYKIGAYKLTDGYGPISISYKNIQFWEGE